jgi:hypothetical protein
MARRAAQNGKQRAAIARYSFEAEAVTRLESGRAIATDEWKGAVGVMSLDAKASHTVVRGRTEMLHVRRNTLCSAPVLLLCLVAVLLTPRFALAAPQTTPLPLALCAPENTFTLNIDNDYFPLPVGRVWVYTGKEQGQNVGLRVTVLDATVTFHFGGGQNITTRVVREEEWADTNANGVIDPGEQLIEVSLNYFAQTAGGTVCYFGENVDIYEDGQVVSYEGSWRADGRRGLPGSAPGIFMPAAPAPGLTFQQEVAPGVAEDQATITRTGTATVDGTVANTITVRDFNPLDGSKGTKVYAEGVGLIQDGPLRLFPVGG